MVVSTPMAAQTREEEQRRRRRKRLVRGLLMGSAAIGLPALANALVSKRARRLPLTTWGSGDVYRWRFGDVVFQRLGEGPPVLLLHSLGPGHSSSEWRRAAEEQSICYALWKECPVLRPAFSRIAEGFLWHKEFLKHVGEELH